MRILKKNAKALQKDKISLESKVNDIEYRSIRDSLVFYGVSEQQNEDCEVLVKQFINEKLESKKISNDQELIQSDPISCPQNSTGREPIL